MERGIGTANPRFQFERGSRPSSSFHRRKIRVWGRITATTGAGGRDKGPARDFGSVETERTPKARLRRNIKLVDEPQDVTCPFQNENQVSAHRKRHFETRGGRIGNKRAKAKR